VFCADNFAYGPIAPGDPAQREAWLRETLDLDPEPIGSDDDFWRQALDPDRRLIGWTSTRVAQERAGFLEWLWRLGDAPCELIDLSTVRAGRDPAVLPLLDGDKIREFGLLDLARPLEPSDRHRLHQTWRRLRDENAPLRMIRAGELVSAPLEAFDQQLLSHVEPEWTRAVRVIGGALGDVFDDWIFQVSEYVLVSRLRALGETGAIETRPCEDLKGMGGIWAYEVRRL